MLRHTTTYRLEGAHSTFHRLLAWGHNYFTFLGKEIVVLTPGPNNTYKISQTKDKTWVKVKFVAKTILAFTLVIPTFAFLLKLGAWRLIHIDHTPVLRPSSSITPPPLQKPLDVEPEKNEPSASLLSRQQSLRRKIWGKNVPLHIWKQKSRKELDNLPKGSQNLKEQIHFVKAYRLAKTIWDKEQDTSFMPKEDLATWSHFTSMYEQLTPSKEAFDKVCGPDTPFDCIAKRFDEETFEIRWTVEEALKDLQEDPTRIEPFKKHCSTYGLRMPNPNNTPVTVSVKTPKLATILSFAMSVGVALMQQRPAQAASREDMWKGALAVVPTGRTDLKASDLAASVSHVEFLTEYLTAQSAWDTIASTASQEEKARWKLTEDVRGCIRSTIQGRLETFEKELTTWNGKNKTPYATSIKGKPKEKELRELMQLVGLLSSPPSSAPQQTPAVLMQRLPSSPLKSSGLGTQAKAIGRLRTVITDLDQQTRTLI